MLPRHVSIPRPSRPSRRAAISRAPSLVTTVHRTGLRAAAILRRRRARASCWPPRSCACSPRARRCRTRSCSSWSATSASTSSSTPSRRTSTSARRCTPRRCCGRRPATWRVLGLGVHTLFDGVAIAAGFMIGPALGILLSIAVLPAQAAGGLHDRLDHAGRRSVARRGGRGGRAPRRALTIAGAVRDALRRRAPRRLRAGPLGRRHHLRGGVGPHSGGEPRGRAGPRLDGLRRAPAVRRGRLARLSARLPTDASKLALAMKFLVLHGPNLNLLGTREPDVYGRMTLAQVDTMLRDHAPPPRRARWRAGSRITRASSSTGSRPPSARGSPASCFNPGAFTHYSIALRDTVAAITRAGRRGPPVQRARARGVSAALRHRRRRARSDRRIRPAELPARSRRPGRGFAPPDSTTVNRRSPLRRLTTTGGRASECRWTRTRRPSSSGAAPATSRRSSRSSRSTGSGSVDSPTTSCATAKRPGTSPRTASSAPFRRLPRSGASPRSTPGSFGS